MPEKQISDGKLAYRLYNKVGATEQDKIRAMQIIANSTEKLDVYGEFVQAELIFWKRSSTAYNYTAAFETFQKILLNVKNPKPLLIGACFFLGRCYELGLGTDYNLNSAYAHYRLANKLNPQACLKDIARLQKIMNAEHQNISTATPDRFKYYDVDETEAEWEYADNIDDWAKEFEQCRKALTDNGFFYPDDPDEIDVNLYDVIEKSNETD